MSGWKRSPSGVASSMRMSTAMRPPSAKKTLTENKVPFEVPRGGELTERLASEPLLRLAPGSIGRRLLDEWLDRHRVRVRSTIDVPSVSLLLAYATGGVGVGLVPALSFDARELRGVEFEHADVPALPVKLVMRAGRRSDPAVEHFVERLERRAERQAKRLAKRRWIA